MDTIVARDLYESQYRECFSEDEFNALLEKGLSLLEQNKNTDKFFVYRHYRDKDVQAVLIALTYNKMLLMHFLKETD